LRDRKLEHAQYHRGHHHVTNGDPAAVLRPANLARAEVLPDARCYRGTEAEADRVEPALDPVSDSECSERGGSEWCYAACENYVDERKHDSGHRGRQADSCDRGN